MRTRLALGFIFASSMALTACGTLTNGGTQTMDVQIKGSPSAFCVISTSVTKNSGSFPNKVIVERSQEPLTVECNGEQNLYKKIQVKSVLSNDSSIGNTTTAMTGMGYDLLSGGAWYYPNPIIVDFRVQQEAPKEIWPANKADAPLGTANIAKPSPVRMQPVMDEDMNPAPNKPAKAKPVEIKPTADASKKASMKPIASPEDDPAVMKAKAEAKRQAEESAKAKAEAKKNAQAEAKAKAAAEAKAKKEAAKAAEEKAETLPEAAPATAPAEPVSSVPATTETTTTTTSTSSTTAAPTPAATPTAPADSAAQSSTTQSTTTTTTTTTPAPTTGTSTDVDKYLSGGDSTAPKP